jgi:large subunit ribosomal protein L22
MEKQYTPKHQPEKSLVANAKPEAKAADAKKPEHQHKTVDDKNSIESKVTTADNKDNKKEEKKTAPKIEKKEEAVAKGLNLHASKKHCMYLSEFIKNKPIDTAISDLQSVIKLKKIVPFKGEIPHRRGKGMMSGRYPVNASKELVYVLKALKGNVIVNGLDLDKTKIYYASASWASRPAKKGGMRFKRTNIILKAREFPTTAEAKK